MAHRIDYSNDGKRARVTLDLNASIDSDLIVLGSDDQTSIGCDWKTVSNVLTDLPNVLRKRGRIPALNSTSINDASGAMSVYTGDLMSGNTYLPIVGTCVDGANVETYMQNATTSRTVLASAAGNGLPVAKCPMVGEWLFLCGREAANSTYPNRAASVIQYGGSSASSDYSTGTVTMTSGSASVTGSGTTWTSSMEGCAFSVNTDTYRRAYYRVRKVVSTTSIILDRNYAGSVTGAGLSYGIEKAPLLYAVDAGPWGSANSNPKFKVACAAWERLVVASTREAGSSAAIGDSTPEYKSRIRWSGANGSGEGSGAALGIYAWNTNGYIDLASKFGEIIALVPAIDSVLVFQERGLTVLRGAPVFDGSGSLDASETHPGVMLAAGSAVQATPRGVFFVDSVTGPCVYDGSGVVAVGVGAASRLVRQTLARHVGYYDGKVLFSGSTRIYVFDTNSRSWSLFTVPEQISWLQPGRTENSQDVVGLAAGVKVVNVTNAFDYPFGWGPAGTDWDGSSPTIDLLTGKIGDTVTHLRPERAFVTYSLPDQPAGGTNPHLTLTVSVGSLDSPGSEQTYSTPSDDLNETASGVSYTSAVVTRQVWLNLAASPMVQVRLVDASPYGRLDILAIVIDCAVEGEGASI